MSVLNAYPTVDLAPVKAVKDMLQAIALIPAMLAGDLAHFFEVCHTELALM